MTAGISTALQQEIEAFLYDEARMLEDNRFDDWLGCFASDVHYWMPVRQSTDPGSGSAIAHDAFCLFDDDKKSLELRVLRILGRGPVNRFQHPELVVCTEN
ncbi:MAG: hypothetical protein K2Y27_03380 [Xanthobacteraceae bacterium]|nr:hypothetical protein [Xanthobacteraceae bacterium]